ncbi:MAG: hypothetical protein ACUVQG_05335 [Thermogutta sp.]
MKARNLLRLLEQVINSDDQDERKAEVQKLSAYRELLTQAEVYVVQLYDAVAQGEDITAKEAFSRIKDLPEDDWPSDVPADYKLPKLRTFTTYLSRGLSKLGRSRNSTRHGRDHGSSIVNATDI